MAGKYALHIAKEMEAGPLEEDSCQSLIRSGTIFISLAILSMIIVQALFRDIVSVMPRQASKRSSMESRASSFLERPESSVHSNPRHVDIHK
jgi:hypothetical protein